MQEIDSLVKMANQIAKNFAFHSDSVERTADHIQRFWAPSMRATLKAHIDGGGTGVSAEVTQALQQVEIPE